MDFVKMHGLGNDFVLVESGSWDIAGKYQSLTRAVCDRRFGIGADGLIVIGPDPGADLFMRIFNSDGSEPEMCGNGIRCVAWYAYKHRLVKKSSMTVRTLAGVKIPVIKNTANNIAEVRVDMGEPVLDRHMIPILGEGDDLHVEVNAGANRLQATGVSMGNPHCIIFVDDAEKIPVKVWGPEIEQNALFPAKTNVEFIQIISDKEIIMRVWERGAGITLACGTGACASMVACVLNNRTGRAVTVHLLGGDLFIEWNEQDNHVYMTGPAAEVYGGQVDLPNLSTDCEHT